LSRNNPYLSRINEFPGRLFSDPLGDNELAALNLILQDAKELIVELGSGSGGHLIELAKQDPSATCIGLELRYKRAFRTIQKSEHLGLKNIHVLRGDGRNFLRSFIGNGAVSRFYVNFPDPWPKRREQKNRILSASFLREIADWLHPSGLLVFRTDQHDYFEQVMGLIQKHKCGLEVNEATEDLTIAPLSIKLHTTEFEHMFLQKGEKINALIAKRLPHQQPVLRP
jgi:tRNA (guanine-N7-)-methyltransferase